MSAARLGGGWAVEVENCESQKPVRHTHRITDAAVPQGRQKALGKFLEEGYSMLK